MFQCEEGALFTVISFSALGQKKLAKEIGPFFFDTICAALIDDSV